MEGSRSEYKFNKIVNFASSCRIITAVHQFIPLDEVRIICVIHVNLHAGPILRKSVDFGRITKVVQCHKIFLSRFVCTFRKISMN